MQNHKVYLAKSSLASGLDFEYVKSNLLRIPNIEIIEYGQGFNPSECACLVYVHDNVNIVQEDVKIFISKSVYNEMDNFLSDENPSDISAVFIYLGKSYSANDDVEPTAPYMVPSATFLHESKKWDKFGTISIEAEEGFCLLEMVSNALEIRDELYWRKQSRHELPDPKYAIKPVPSLEERKSKGTKRKTNIVDAKSTLSNFPPQYNASKKPRETPKIAVLYEEEHVAEDLAVINNSRLVDDIISSRKPRRHRSS